MNTGYMLSGTSPYGVGNGGGGSDAYGLGAVENYNLQFQPGGPGQPTTVQAPISLLIFTVGGAIAGAMTKSAWGIILGGALGYMAGAGLRATTGLKA